MKEPKGIKLYVPNYTETSFDEGFGLSGYVSLSKQGKLIYGETGSPYSEGWTKEIELPKCFLDGPYPAAILCVAHETIKNGFFCYYLFG